MLVDFGGGAEKKLFWKAGKLKMKSWTDWLLKRLPLNLLHDYCTFTLVSITENWTFGDDWGLQNEEEILPHHFLNSRSYWWVANFFALYFVQIHASKHVEYIANSQYKQTEAIYLELLYSERVSYYLHLADIFESGREYYLTCECLLISIFVV